MTSANGTTWASSDLGSYNGQTINVLIIADTKAGTIYLAEGNAGLLLEAHGLAGPWTRLSTNPFSPSFYQPFFYNGYNGNDELAGFSGGTIYKYGRDIGQSLYTDFSTYSDYTVQYFDRVWSVGDGEFHATYGNQVYVSTDLFEWTPGLVTFGSMPCYNIVPTLRKSIGGSKTYVAVSNSGTILTSPDGMNWSTATIPTTSQINDLAYDGRIFVAVGDQGTILTSADGTTWNTCPSGTTSNLQTIEYGNGCFVAGGDNGTILYSGSGISIITENLPAATVGTGYSCTLSASGGTAPYTWNASGLPAGLSLGSSSGVISGTPTAAGTSTVTATVYDSANLSTSRSLSLTVNPAPTVLTITTTSLPSGTAGSPYSATLSAGGGTAPYTWSASGLPSGLNLNTVTGEVYGIPALAETSTVAATVYDSANNNITNSFSLTINPAAPALTITTTSLPSGTAGLPYSATLAATGGIAPYTWSATGLLSGLFLNTVTGEVYGTPTTAGTATVAVTVFDSASHTISANFSLTINPASGGGGGGGGGAPAPQPVNSTSGSATFNPSAGGTVGLGSDVSLKIPANALQGTDSAQVAVQKVGAPPASPSGFMVIGAVYQFTVNGQNHYNFNKLVTLTFNFDPANFAPGETLAVYYYDEAKGDWVNIGGTVSGNTITVTVDHFTRFAVLAKQEEKQALVLTDIAGHWAEENIEKLVVLGAVTGYPDGTFRPDHKITRAEFAAILVKAFKLAPQGGKVFADTTSHWAKEYIATAASYGIVNGYDADTFGPDDLITREQMAVMVVKAAKLTITPGETSFEDNASISAWASSAVAAAVRNGIIKGYPDHTFQPQGNATRAEAVTVIVNALR